MEKLAKQHEDELQGSTLDTKKTLAQEFEQQLKDVEAKHAAKIKELEEDAEVRHMWLNIVRVSSVPTSENKHLMFGSLFAWYRLHRLRCRIVYSKLKWRGKQNWMLSRSKRPRNLPLHEPKSRRIGKEHFSNCPSQ